MTTLAQLHDCHSCNDERSIVQKKNPLSIGLPSAWAYCPAHSMASLPFILPLIWLLSVSLFVYSSLMLSFPCPLFFLPLSSPWWASLGILSGSSLPSPFSLSLILAPPLFFSFLLFLLDFSCHLSFAFSLPFAFFSALSHISPSCGQPGHTVRLVTPRYPTYYLILFRSPLPSSLPFLPSFLSFPLFKVFAQSGFAQRGSTL